MGAGAGDIHYFFRVPNSLEGCEGWGIPYIKASVVQWKDRPWRPEFGPEGKHLFLEIVDFFIFVEQRSCAGWRARSAPLGVAMSPKRRVRAAHGRLRAAKTH